MIITALIITKHVLAAIAFIATEVAVAKIIFTQEVEGAQDDLKNVIGL